MASPAASSAGDQVLIAASTKGAAPTFKPLSDFAMKPAIPEMASWGTQYSAITLASLNAAATKMVYSNFNGSGYAYDWFVALKRSDAQWNWVGITSRGVFASGNVTSAGMTMTNSQMAKAKVTGSGALFTFVRSGGTVWVQCSGRATNVARNAWDTIMTVPAGYRPAFYTPDEDSIWIKGSVNGAMADFQIFSDGVFRSSSTIASGSSLIIGATWLSDNTMPA
jgi:hypothetical protein